MSLDDKFARIGALRPPRKQNFPVATVSGPPAQGDRLAEILGAEIRRNHFGELLSVKRWYATPEICSPADHSVSLLLPQSEESGSATKFATEPERWLFLDTETTGLAGGTGTYAFLVGIAWWEAGGLQVEQFFLRDLNEEHSLLLELSERMAQRPVLVTFNGKSFDWPLLETRYQMTRSIPAYSPKIHLDLLHPARQLWRLRLGTVRLRDLEQHVLAEHGPPLDWSRADDIDSSLIPQAYFDYLRGGSADPLIGVFRHNQMDLRGLAALAGRIFALLDQGHGTGNSGNWKAQDATQDAIEVFGLSRLLRKRGHSSRARELYESALRLGSLPQTAERLAQRELAQLAKREQDYARAVSLWDELRQAHKKVNGRRAYFLAGDLQKTLETAIEAAEEMAIYYEHRVKQPGRALELIRTAVTELRRARAAGQCARGRAEKIECRLARRLERLKRRCARDPLFDIHRLDAARRAYFPTREPQG